jgi:hypothetical protein
MGVVAVHPNELSGTDIVLFARDAQPAMAAEAEDQLVAGVSLTLNAVLDAAATMRESAGGRA